MSSGPNKSYHGGAERYHTEVEYLKDGKIIKRDNVETSDSKAEATKNFQRSIRLADSDDYGQDEVWVHMFDYGSQVKFKAIKIRKANTGRKLAAGEWIPGKGVRVTGKRLELLK